MILKQLMVCCCWFSIVSRHNDSKDGWGYKDYEILEAFQVFDKVGDSFCIYLEYNNDEIN